MAEVKTAGAAADCSRQYLVASSKLDPRFAKVAIGSGHMIDKPNRQDERFPPRKEGVVRDQLAQRLEKWRIARATWRFAVVHDAARTSSSASSAPIAAPRSG